MGDSGDECRIGIRRGNQFQQPHIARRIKEVRAEPRTAKICRESFCDLRDRKTAGVGGDDGAGLTDGINFLQQGPLDFEVLDNRLDDPIDFAQAFQIVIEIPYGDEPR